MPALFYNSSGLHPSLHSFPTRRSSDLKSSQQASILVVDAQQDRDRDAIRDDATAAERQQWHRRDRKSTRLNSSHSQTSYAGSCFKKKNSSPIDETKKSPGCGSSRSWPT